MSLAPGVLALRHQLLLRVQGSRACLIKAGRDDFLSHHNARGKVLGLPRGGVEGGFHLVIHLLRASAFRKKGTLLFQQFLLVLLVCCHQAQIGFLRRGGLFLVVGRGYHVHLLFWWRGNSGRTGLDLDGFVEFRTGLGNLSLILLLLEVRRSPFGRIRLLIEVGEAFFILLLARRSHHRGGEVEWDCRQSRLIIITGTR